MDPSLLRKAYDRDAPGYDVRFAGQQRAKYEVIARLVPPPGPGLVLDVGGGTGMLAPALVKHDARWGDARFLVIDLSRGMLEQARARGLDTLQADARRLPLRRGVAHRIICVTGLVETAHVERALVSAARVCAPEGLVAFSLLPWNVPDDLSRVIDRLPLEPVAEATAGTDRMLVWRRRAHAP